MENNFDNIPEEQKVTQDGQNVDGAASDPAAKSTDTEAQNVETAAFDSAAQNANTEAFGDSAGNTGTGTVYQQYSDPNGDAGYQQQYTSTGGYTQYTSSNNGYTQNQSSYGYQQQGQNYTNYQQQYQDNYNYNVNTPSYNQNNDGQDTTPLSMGEWLLTLILLAIPCLNIVLYFVWGFGKNGNVNRRNYCRAGLILAAIGYVICIIVFIIIMVAGGIGSSYYYY